MTQDRRRTTITQNISPESPPTPKDPDQTTDQISRPIAFAKPKEKVASLPATNPIPQVEAITPVETEPATPSPLPPPTRTPPLKQTGFGRRRGNMRIVQTSLPPTIATALDTLALQQGVPMGEVLMDAFGTFRHTTGTEPTNTRRSSRQPGGSVRKELSIRPSEADEIAQYAQQLGVTPSWLMRTALIQHIEAPRK